MDTPIREMTVEQLKERRRVYSDKTESAPGWASAFAYAEQLQQIEAELRERGEKL